MSVPRIARIHLVYQFIILTLLIFAISYNEILPDKRFLFLALIPVFCYQLLIVFCCTELVPLPTWFNWAETEVATDPEQTSDSTESQEVFSSEGTKSPKESNVISPKIPRAHLSTKNNVTPDSVTSSDANTQTVRQNIADIFIKKGPVFTKASARRSESIKSYCFANRENRFDNLDTKEIRLYKDRNWRSLKEKKGTKSQSNLKCQGSPVEENKESVTTSPVSKCEDGLTTKEILQSFQIQNWRSPQDQNDPKSQSNLKSPGVSVKETKENVMSPVKLETLEESIETDLARSYSFPFRQRKQSRVMELDDDLVTDLNIPVMPAWNAIDYFSPTNTKRRRKSVSTEAIDRELRLINSHFEQNPKNDFTQSMEASTESVVKPVGTKRALKPSASFNRWKQDISSFFNKTKRESVKEDSKQDGDGKKPFFRELFLSKDNLYQEPEKKPVKRSNSSVPKSDNRVKLSYRSPSYISYDNDFFGEE